MGRAPLVLPLLAIVVGILAATAFAGCSAIWAIPPLIIGGIAFLMKRYASGLYMIYGAVGFMVAIIQKPEPLAFYGRHRLECDVLEIGEASTSGRIAVVEVTSVDSQKVSPFKMRLYTLSERPYVTSGQQIEISVKIKELQSAVDIPDIVDLAEPMRRRGVVATGTVAREDMKVIGNTPGIYACFRRVHADLVLKLMQADLSAESIDMLLPMLLGFDSNLGNERRELYSAAGLSHLLALSGMHVGIIAMLVSIALWPLYVGRHNRTRMAVTILALWCYAMLTGMSPSVTRAVIMMTVYLVGRIIERKPVSINTLCLAAIVILLVNPSDLFSVGFQMSFAAVAGIILFYPLINRLDYRRHPWLYRIASYPSLSLSAMILTGIVSAFHFHSYPLLFLFANILVVPVVPLFVSTGAVVLLSSLCGVSISWLNSATDFMASTIDWIARFTAGLPCCSVSDIYFPGWFAVSVIVALILVALGQHRCRKFTFLLGWLALAGSCGLLWAMPAKVYGDECYVIDDYRHKHLIMKQGDRCLFFTTSIVDQEREDYRRFYSELLEEYMLLRDIDSLELAPVDALPFTTVGNDTLIVCLDSCQGGGTLVYRKLDTCMDGGI